MSITKKVKEFFGFVEEAPLDLDLKVTPEEPEQQTIPFNGKVISTSNTRRFSASEIKVVEPRIYEDSLNIASYLRENKPVIVNLKYLDATSGKRLIDFICGTAYAINGHMMKIGDNIFLFTPSSVLIAETSDQSTFEQGLQEEAKETFFKQTASL